MDNKRTTINTGNNTEDREGEDDLEFKEIVNRHEQLTNWDGLKLVKYKGFHIPLIFLKNVVHFEEHFEARDEDIIVASYPKSGTTWLKSLAFSIARRYAYGPTDPTHPLLATNSHYLVPSLEYNMRFDDSERIARGCPRMLGVHLAHGVLPRSVHESACKIIYICRNPLDQFVSYYHFSLKNFAKKGASPLALDRALDGFCEGIDFFGPIWDQVLSYWEAHARNPKKVLFLKYEDLKEDTVFYVKKIAEFIRLPFSAEEERQGVPEKIIALCSFENLSNLQVNKDESNEVITVKSLFRKGIVGDWKNLLTPEMAQRIQTITANKFEGTGLAF